MNPIDSHIEQVVKLPPNHVTLNPIDSHIEQVVKLPPNHVTLIPIPNQVWSSRSMMNHEFFFQPVYF